MASNFILIVLFSLLLPSFTLGHGGGMAGLYPNGSRDHAEALALDRYNRLSRQLLENTEENAYNLFHREFADKTYPNLSFQITYETMLITLLADLHRSGIMSDRLYTRILTAAINKRQLLPRFQQFIIRQLNSIGTLEAMGSVYLAAKTHFEFADTLENKETDRWLVENTTPSVWNLSRWVRHSELPPTPLEATELSDIVYEWVKGHVTSSDHLVSLVTSDSSRDAKLLVYHLIHDFNAEGALSEKALIKYMHIVGPVGSGNQCELAVSGAN